MITRWIGVIRYWLNHSRPIMYPLIIGWFYIIPLGFSAFFINPGQAGALLVGCVIFAEIFFNEYKDRFMSFLGNLATVMEDGIADHIPREGFAKFAGGTLNFMRSLSSFNLNVGKYQLKSEYTASEFFGLLLDDDGFVYGNISETLKRYCIVMRWLLGSSAIIGTGLWAFGPDLEKWLCL